MRAWKAFFGLGALAFGLGCGEGAVPPPAAPKANPAPPVSAAPPSTVAPAAPDPFAVPDEPKDPTDPGGGFRMDAWEAAVKAKAVAASPQECAAFAKRAATKPAPPDLVTALATKESAKRDAMLVAVEGSLDAKSPGIVRGLRADLAPGACGDVIVDPYLGSHRDLPRPVLHVLVGLSLAAKLERTGAGRPSMGAVTEKEKVKAFVAGPLKKWMVEQSTAIETLSSGAAGLTGYGRGIAALAAGIADMRLVDVIRSAPTPPGWDPELKAIYQSTLDEALEPRKRRGRDAALVGLGDLAAVGVLVDARTVAAHALLTSLYGGRRIGALSELLVPRPPDPIATTPAQLAIAAVPTFWLASALPAPEGAGADDLILFARGTPASATTRQLRPEMLSALARSNLRLGQASWRRIDFIRAARLAKLGTTPEDWLMLALSLSLARGPNGAAEMMRAPTASALELQHTEALDVVASEGGPYAGWAAFDAAHLRSLSPPEGPSAAPYFRDVAARFRNAETLLTDPTQKKLALKRADEIDAILATKP